MAGSPFASLPIRVAAVVVGGFLALLIFTALEEGDGRPQSSIEAKRQDCNKTLDCWAKRHSSSLEQCTKAIEKLTLFDFRWTDPLLESKYTKYRWHSVAAHTITYSGDSLLVQNAQGAFVRTAYECDYDPIGNQAISARVWPGRLGQ